uniref:Uncharacterized protein n=1 Tax=Magallana gigas TaxID=29159 RepID=K1R120_MAGGI
MDKRSCPAAGPYRITAYDCFPLIHNVANTWVFVKVKHRARELTVTDPSPFLCWSSRQMWFVLLTKFSFALSKND